MSTVKITDLPVISSLDANTGNTILVGVDLSSDVTGRISATVLADGLYENKSLKVGLPDIIFPNVIAQFAGSGNPYLQVNAQNTDKNSSIDYVATADIGTTANNFIDMGMNNSLYNDPNFSAQKALDGYLYVHGSVDSSSDGNLIIGTVSSGANVVFAVGGQKSANVVATISRYGLSMNGASYIKFADGSIQSVAAAPASLSQGAYNTANSASSNTVLIQGVNATQNTNITTANNHAWAAFTKANNALANTSGTFAGDLTITGNLIISNTATINGTLTPTLSANGNVSAYASKHLVEYNPTTKALTYSSTPDASSPYITGYSQEIHVSPVAFNDSGKGTIGDPIKTIARAIQLIAPAFETTSVNQRKTIVLHPGDYAENVTINTQYTVLTTHELIGKNTTLSGTLTLTTGCTVDGLKMSNLVISGTSANGSVDIIGCTVTTAATKTSSAYTNFRGCDLSSSTLSITGTGTVVMVGGNYFSVTVNNAAASVLAKAVVSMGPVTLTAGTMQISDTLIYAATNIANAITQSAGSVLTLNNSQTLIPDLSNVSRNSFGGFYSILHSVYDKPNSTFGGTSLNAIDYSQYINADNLNVQGNATVNGTVVLANSNFLATEAAFRITASGSSQTPTQAGTLMQLTGKANTPARILIDSIGISNTAYSLIAGRTARGTVGAPTATQNNDILLRIAGNSYGDTGYAPFGDARIDFVATENHSDTNRGSRIRFWNTPTGSNVVNEIASFNGDSVTFTGTVAPVKGFIYTPNIYPSAQTAVTISFANDSVVRAQTSAGLAVTLSNFVVGKSVEAWITNTAGGGQTFTHGCSATNSTVNSTTYSIPATSTIFVKYWCMDGTLANTFVAITHA